MRGRAVSARRSRRPRRRSAPGRVHPLLRLILHPRTPRRIAFLLLAILVLTIVLDRLRPSAGRAGGDWDAWDQQPVRVVKVVDGDTVHVKPPSSEDVQTVRLIGVDAPETDAYWGERATAYLAARAAGKEVVLRLEPLETRDRYGRLLAYLYASESENLNQSLVRDGQAYADRRFDHTYRAQFEQTEAEARKRRRGLWKDVRDEQQPPWRQR